MSKTLVANLKCSDRAQVFEDYWLAVVKLHYETERRIKNEGQRLGGISF